MSEIPWESDELEVELANGQTITVTIGNKGECRSCGEEILWCTTKNGKHMPVDIPDAPGDTTTSHFATCMDADKWRKRK